MYTNIKYMNIISLGKNFSLLNIIHFASYQRVKIFLSKIDLQNKQILSNQVLKMIFDKFFYTNVSNFFLYISFNQETAELIPSVLNSK